MNLSTTYSKEEVDKLVAYMMDIVRLVHFLSINELKLKIAKICLKKHTPFEERILERSKFKWFKKRHP